MESDEKAAAAIVTLLLAKKNKKKRKRSVWVKPWLRRRINLGVYETVVQELRPVDELQYKKILGMTLQNFDEFFGLICGSREVPSRFQNEARINNLKSQFKI